MMLVHKTPIYALFALGACVLSSGCVQRECTDEEREAAGADGNDDCDVFVPLREFTADDAEESSIAWSSGTDLEIRGDVRSVSIVKGGADDTLVVSFKAQVDLAQDREQSVVDKTMSHLTQSLKRSGNTLEVSANRGDTESNLGAAITVELPDGFDSDIVIDKTTRLPGDVSIKYLGNTRQLVVDMDGLGADLGVGDASRLRRATLNTRGDIETSAFGALDAAAIHSSHGDISAAFSNVPESHAKIVAEFGQVALKLPTDGAFNLRAEGEHGVSTGNAPEACQSSAVPSPKLMQCGGGDPDGITFDVDASQEVFISFD